MLDVFGHFCVFVARIMFAMAVAALVYVVMTAGRNLFKVKQRLTSMGRILLRVFFSGLSADIIDVEHCIWKPLVNWSLLISSNNFFDPVKFYRMPTSRRVRIQPFFCGISELDDISVDECFHFHSSAFDTVENNYHVTYVRNTEVINMNLLYQLSI